MPVRLWNLPKNGRSRFSRTVWSCPISLVNPTILRRIQLPVGELPGLPNWEWIATPGHSPGHVSFFRSSDRVLIAGDAFATMDMDSWSGLVGGKKELARSGAPFVMDWNA